MAALLLPIQQALRDAAAAPGLARELALALEAADWLRVDRWVGLLLRWGWR